MISVEMTIFLSVDTSIHTRDRLQMLFGYKNYSAIVFTSFGYPIFSDMNTIGAARSDFVDFRCLI